MQHDSLDKLSKYLDDDIYEKISPFLSVVSSNMDEGKYEIDGDVVFAKVMSYSTKLSNDCCIEAHNEYIDIQFSLIGEETIEVFEREKLEVVNDYDKASDVLFFADNHTPFCVARNIVGEFTLLNPCDAHKPMVSRNNKCEKVKKCVIKVHV